MYRQRVPKATVVLIVINVLYFIYLTVAGSSTSAQVMLEHGALFTESVLVDHEYYRLVTSMFMHFGIEHLFFNMLLFYYLGTLLEDEMGMGVYTFTYLFAGIIGNIASVMYYSATDPFVISAGASGAVFGLVGVVAWQVIRHHGRYGRIGMTQIALMIVFSLYNGITEGGVNNVAHIAGLAAGFLCGVLFLPSRNNQTGGY